MHWARFPFLRITPVFIFGIMAFSIIDVTFSSCYFLMLLAVITLILYFLLARFTGSFFNHKIYTVIVLISFFWLGFLASEVTYVVQKPSFSDALLATSTNYTIRINSKGDSTENFIKYLATIEKASIRGKWQRLSTKVIVYFRHGTNTFFKYGDEILIAGSPTYVDNQKNPAAFDYGLFLQRKGIFLQDYIEAEGFKLINAEQNRSLKYWGLFAGDYLENTVSSFISSPRELNIVKAMLLGRRNEISPEMEYVYQSTGTAHILAVSGLHVGIVFIMVSTLFKFLKGRKPRWLFYGIVLFAIWSFAMITGFSPSVQRAATMFSFIIVGEFLNRKSNIYNSILASAFFILLFSPNLIYSVAFQLSYVAVLGIVFLYYKIYPLVYIRNRFLDFFWKITVLSISVQLATFSISIYYFHQFPVLFAITNLFAIPTAMVVLGGSFAILATSFIDFVPNMIALILKWWIFAYNEIMFFISERSFSLIPNLYLKPYHVFLLLLLVVLGAQFLSTKKLLYFRYFTFALIILAGITLYDYQKNLRQEQIVFYYINEQCNYDIFIGRSCYTNISSDNGVTNEDEYFNVLPYRIQHLIEEVYNSQEFQCTKKIGNNRLIFIQNKSILILDDLNSLTKQEEMVSIDHLVVGKSMIKNLSESMDFLHFKQLILDNTITTDNYKKILDEVPTTVAIHSIRRDGAYVIGI